MSALNYPAIVDKEPGSDFCVIFPDFPGCVSAGSSLEEAISNAREAIAGHIALMVQDGDTLPTPSRFDSVAAQQDETTVAVVHIAVATPGKPKRISITLDDALLDEIDAVGSNRSRFLNEAARAELARRRA
jgi:predicted RNase H-like HicB family nuclease